MAGSEISTDVILPTPGPLADRLVRAGCNVVVLPHRRWTSGRRSARKAAARFAQNVFVMPQLIRHLRAVRADLIVTSTLTVPAGAFAAHFCGTPHLWWIQEYGAEDHGLSFDWGSDASLRVMNRLSDAIVVNSRAVATHFRRRFTPGKVHVVYYGVDCPTIQRRDRRPDGEVFRLVLVGNKAPGKGQHDAVLAVKEIVRAGYKVRLDLVGPASDLYNSSLELLIRANGLSGLIANVAEVAEPWSFFMDANAALMCSRSEAFGRVTIEAMKAGLPVVGANSGATPELVREGFNGLLYKAGEPTDLARKVIELIRDPSLVERLGRQARDWARATFTLERFATDFLAVARTIARQGSV
jgi:glycosyltransferase involved in cell wall biosynthesis